MARLRHCGQWVDATLDGHIYRCPECGNAVSENNSIEVAGRRIRPGDEIVIVACDGEYGPLTVTEVTETKVQMFVEEGLTPALYTDTADGHAVLEGHGGSPVKIVAIQGGEEVDPLEDLAELIDETTAARGVDIYAVEHRGKSASEWAEMTGRDRSTVSRNISRGSD